MRTFEGHSEIIGFGIQRITGMGYLILLGFLIHLGDVDIETTHAHMTIAAEIEVAVRTEGREHLIARGIDGFAEVFHTTQSGSGDAHTPDVVSAHAARHI